MDVVDQVGAIDVNGLLFLALRALDGKLEAVSRLR